MIDLDTETAGFVGPIVLLQFSRNEGPVVLHDVWKQPVGETLALIESFCREEVCGFNLVFDWFHLQMDYCVLSLCERKDLPPIKAEYLAILKSGKAFEGPRLKPVSALDLYLHALHGPMQTLMNRDDVVIRRVPALMAQPLADELSRRVDFDKIFFQRVGGKQWTVDASVDPEFPNVQLVFGAAAGLKPLVQHIFGEATIDYPTPPELMPKYDKKHGWDLLHQDWPEKLEGLIHYWGNNPKARQYATNDVLYLPRLRHHWGNPPFGDDDSVLACHVASARWRGFGLRKEDVRPLRAEMVALARSVPRAPKPVKKRLHELCDITERLGIKDTSGPTLELVGRWLKDGPAGPMTHPAAQFAKQVEAARTAEKRANLLGKLEALEGLVHPDYKIIGTRSARMSGASGLNFQAVDNWALIRRLFTFATEGEAAWGGDFNSFEPSIAHGVYKDLQLGLDLTSGKKIHGLFGVQAYDLDYEVVIADKAAGGIYDRAKKGFLAYMYGGQAFKIGVVLNKTEEEAEAILAKIANRYPQMADHRLRTAGNFCSMRQPAGLGTRVEWHEPADYVESFLGDKRYYLLENKVCHALFDLAQDLPDSLKDLGKFKVRRREDRVQWATGAVMSALFGAAFQIQASNMRSALNHEIQSPGARICKNMQRRIDDLQPSGVHPWVVRTANTHDELAAVGQPSVGPTVEGKVIETVEHFRRWVPLLAMGWKRINDWSDLK